MIYNDFKGMKLSALGMGCMRFPLKSEKETDIDETAVAEMVRFALDSGINYFDTAWRYHGGCSETVIGKALSAYPRDSYYLATKFPGFDLSNMSKVEEIFEDYPNLTPESRMAFRFLAGNIQRDTEKWKKSKNNYQKGAQKRKEKPSYDEEMMKYIKYLKD